MSKWVSRIVIVVIISLVTAVVILGLSLRQWVDKAEEASLKAEALNEEVFTLRRLLKQKGIIIPERRGPLEELRYMPGEVLVRFQEEVTNEEKTALIEKWDFEVIEKVILTDIYRLKLPAGVTVSEAVERIKQQEKVKYAQPNYIYRIGM